MAKKIIFASANAGKIAEMNYLINKDLGSDIKLLGLKDIGFTDEIIESGTSFEENANIKARAIWDHSKTICFADDSGLCVDFLNGAPGVYSARYGAGIPGGGIKRLLDELKDAPDEQRGAHFYCAIYCIVDESTSFCVSGRCEGTITQSQIGEGGFGYDPVFYYPPLQKTFAQLSKEEKNKVSHRAVAIGQFTKILAKHI
ncbi:MAG: RdgB/HAM1 family non-canonical purine NTP pyrophosphatase [Oscillospiraceae bacterium]|nr:RdgB/HAM1 family non-canonical purine NTP pyrophosphatase [Oscillospiraceae bacterium]